MPSLDRQPGSSGIDDVAVSEAGIEATAVQLPSETGRGLALTHDVGGPKPSASEAWQLWPRTWAPHAQHRRMVVGLIGSLVFHALLLSLTFSGQGAGFPGFSLPWSDRRVEVPADAVVAMPTPVTAFALLADTQPPAVIAARSTPIANSTLSSNAFTVKFAWADPPEEAPFLAAKVKPKAKTSAKTHIKPPNKPAPIVPSASPPPSGTADRPEITAPVLRPHWI